MKNFLMLVLGLSSTSAMADTSQPYLREIWYYVPVGVFEPSFQTVSEQIVSFLKNNGFKIADFSVTKRNGRGDPIGGSVHYLPSIVPIRPNELVHAYGATADCSWSNIFSKAQEAIRFASYADQALYSIEIMRRNSLGKPCYIDLEFLKSDNRKPR